MGESGIREPGGREYVSEAQIPALGSRGEILHPSRIERPVADAALRDVVEKIPKRNLVLVEAGAIGEAEEISRVRQRQEVADEFPRISANEIGGYAISRKGDSGI